MHVTNGPLLGRVIDGLMAGVGVTDPKVGFEVVSVDGLSFVPNGPTDEGMKGLPRHVRDALDTDISAPLDGPGDPRLVALVGAALALGLAADQGFVHFDDTANVGPVSGSLPIASRMRWQRYQAVL